MKKILLSAGLLLLAGVLLALPTGKAYADTINYNNFIDDVVFDNKNSMTAAQIDAFLNTFQNSCISTNKGFSSPDPTGFNPSQGFLFGGNVSAGTVIYHAAQAYEINPQVLIATLQKEQSLVTGTAGCYPNTPDKNASYLCNLYGRDNNNDGVIDSKDNTNNCTGACPYNGGCVPIAVGYGCPGRCNANQEGFSNQIIRAAWLLSFDRHRAEGQADWYVMKPSWDNTDDAQSCYSGPMTQGTWRVCPSGGTSYYDGYYTTKDPATVHIDNGATAALYHYTPFKHGQDLFFNTFTNWFGSTMRYNVPTELLGRYDEMGNESGSLGEPIDNAFCNDSRSVCWQQFEDGYLIYSTDTGAWESRGSIRAYWAKIGYQNGKLGFPVAGEVYAGNGLWWQEYQDGVIIGSDKTGYWESMGEIRERWGQLGYQSSSIGLPVDKEVDNTDGSGWQQYQNGFIVKGPGAAAAWESKGAIRAYWGKIGYQGGKAGWPTGPEQYDSITKTWSQTYQKGTIRYSDAKGGWFT
jgi:hypothetical protein